MATTSKLSNIVLEKSGVGEPKKRAVRLVERLHGAARGLSQAEQDKLTAELKDLRRQLTPAERKEVDALAEEHKERVREDARPMTLRERAALARWVRAGKAPFDFWVGRPHMRIDIGVAFPARRKGEAVTAFWSTDLRDMTAKRALVSDDGKTFAPWVAYVQDSAACRAVLLALIARREAAHDGLPALSLAAGDALLTAIRVGQLDGARARRKAEAARRRYAITTGVRLRQGAKPPLPGDPVEGP